jgi:hypothetical protein
MLRSRRGTLGGKTARGRWQCVILLGVPYQNELAAMVGFGVYQTEYIKENSIPAFKKIHFHLIFRMPFHEGWVKTPVVFHGRRDSGQTEQRLKTLPERYVVPFEFKNPVTDKELRTNFWFTSGGGSDSTRSIGVKS